MRSEAMEEEEEEEEEEGGWVEVMQGGGKQKMASRNERLTRWDCTDLC